MVFKYSFRRRFEASHRLWLSKGDDCNNIHGHSFYVNLLIGTDSKQEFTGLLTPEDKGYLFPFASVKKEFWRFVDDVLDHSTLLNTKDPLVTALHKTTENPKILLFRSDPTTEELALHCLVKFYSLTKDLLLSESESQSSIEAIGIKIEETPTNHVTVWKSLRMLKEQEKELKKHFPYWSTAGHELW